MGFGTSGGGGSGGGSPAVASVAEVNTGTDNAKIPTALALEGSKYLTQAGTKVSATASGTNTYTATLSPAITAYVTGQRFFITFTNANSGAATLNLNSLGAIAIKKNGTTALASGDIPAGSVGLVAYDGTNFQLLNPFTITVLSSTTNVIEEITTTASSATPTPTGGSLRNFFTITALAANATFAAPSGTPANGNKLLIRYKDNGTARTLAYNAIFRAIGVTLKTTTVASKTGYLFAVYNSADSKWDVLSVGEEA